MDQVKAQLELKIDAILGEGAFWNHQTQELYWVDIEGKLLHIYHPETKVNRSLETPSRIGTVVPSGKKEAVVALEDGVYLINTLSGDLILLAAIEPDLPGNRLNDGKCDPAGRFWVGSMSIEEQPGAGKLYRLDEDGVARPQLDNISISNGIVWTGDHRTMYYIDTPSRQVRAYDFDLPSGKITQERVAVEIDRSLGFPDGMAIDAEDMLWVAMWQGCAVLRFDPRRGKLLAKIDVPALKITSCAFGGPELDALFITSASIHMTPAEHRKFPDAGSLFKANVGVSGVKSTFFK